jgi:hypothetical protein
VRHCDLMPGLLGLLLRTSRTARATAGDGRRRRQSRPVHDQAASKRRPGRLAARQMHAVQADVLCTVHTDVSGRPGWASRPACLACLARAQLDWTGKRYGLHG